MNQIILDNQKLSNKHRANTDKRNVKFQNQFAKNKTNKILVKKEIIFEAIKKSPGIRFNEIKRQTGFQNGTITHNLKKLIKLNKIQTYEKQGIKRYFSTDVKDSKRIVLHFLRMKTPQRIIWALLETNEMTVSKMALKIHKSLGTVSIYKDMLLHERILKRDINNSVCYRLRNSNDIRQIINEYNHNLSKNGIYD